MNKYVSNRRHTNLKLVLADVPYVTVLMVLTNVNCVSHLHGLRSCRPHGISKDLDNTAVS